MISDTDYRLQQALQFLARATTIAETDHPAWEHEQAIEVIRTWVRTEARDEARKLFMRHLDNESAP